MAFKFNDLSSMIQSDPVKASEALTGLFAKHGGSAIAVANELKVSRATVFRWLKRLESAGHQDPRAGQRGVPGRRASK